MNIALYVPSITKSPALKFIVGTFFPLFKHFKDQNIFLITDFKDFSIPGFERIVVNPQPKNILLKRLWIDKVLISQLRKIRADILISAGDFSLPKTSFPHLILKPDPEKLQLSYIKKANLVVISETDRQSLITQMGLVPDKIMIVHPLPQKGFFPIDDEKIKLIKEKYSDNKEYFIINAGLQKKDELISLLKSFSHFKKRQQSNFKLMLLIDSNTLLQKDMENYKYRNDVILIRSDSNKEKAAITAAAYAMIHPSYTDCDMISVLNAMQSGIPVIATKNQIINEIVGDTVLYAENEIKDLGEKMMQLYRDETLRSQLIEQGKEKMKNYTEENSATQLWQAIMKVTN